MLAGAVLIARSPGAASDEGRSQMSWGLHPDVVEAVLHCHHVGRLASVVDGRPYVSSATERPTVDTVLKREPTANGCDRDVLGDILTGRWVVAHARPNATGPARRRRDTGEVRFTWRRS
jgi:hypothetical protein